MKLTKMRKTLSKTVQEDDYEPFRSENTVEAELESGDNARDVGDTLFHIAAGECNRDLAKRAAEIDMDPETLQKVMSDNPVVVDEEIVLPGSDGVQEETIPPWELDNE